MEIGDKVEFAGDWLRNTGQLTGEVPFMQGEIVDLQPLNKHNQVATVEFNWLRAHGANAHISPPQRVKALTSNLEIVDRKGASE